MNTLFLFLHNPGVAVPFFLFGLPIICGTIIALAAIIARGRNARQQQVSSEDEARTMQELHQTCLRLEERIDALETILLETERKKTTQ
ncbi:MAG: hypothetical protein WD490_00610 [Opitutales bacterium]